MNNDVSYFNDIRDKNWPKGLYRRATSFRFRRMFRGKILIEVWGEIDLIAAVNRANRYNCDIQEGRNPVVAWEHKTTTVQEFLEGWISKKVARLRPKSQKRYQSILASFVAFLHDSKGDAFPLTDLSVDDVQRYMAFRASNPIMPNGHKRLNEKVRAGVARKTLHFELTLLKQCFREAVEEQFLPVNPCIKVFKFFFLEKERSRMPAKIRYLTQLEEAALLDAAGKIESQSLSLANLRDILFVFIRTGLREQELRWLEWTDVDFESNIIQVREKDVIETRTVIIPRTVLGQFAKLSMDRSGDDSLFRHDKEVASFAGVLAIREVEALKAIRVSDVDISGRFIRTTRMIKWKPKATQGDIPMCRAVREILRRLHSTRESNFVFGHADGGSCRMQLWEQVKKAQVLANITRNVRLHDLRHTFAVRLRRKGVRLEVLKDLMRHADISQTLIYAPYDLTEGQQAIALLDDEPISPSGAPVGEIQREHQLLGGQSISPKPLKTGIKVFDTNGYAGNN